MKILFFIIFLNSFLAAESPLLPESTVAVVNGIAISEDELNKEVGKLLPNTYYHSTVDEKKLKDLKVKALKSLIDDTLLYSYAKVKKIKVTDEELEEVIEKLEEAYGSEKVLDGAIRRLGFSMATFKMAVEKDLVLKKLYKKEIEKLYTYEELKEYYDKNKYKFKEPEKIKVRLIYTRNDPTDPEGRAKAKARADKALKEINEGSEFADVAAKYSNAMSRINGGDMGYLHRGRLEVSVEDVAFTMESNTTSGIIDDNIGFYIVKVEDKLESNQLKFENVKDGLEKDLKKKEEQKRNTELIETLKSTAVIIK